jgi:putative ABC transport system permease protein
VQDELSYDQFHARADRIYRVAGEYADEAGVRAFARAAPLLAPTLKQDFPEVEQAVPFARFSSVVSKGDKQFYENEGVFC